MAIFLTGATGYIGSHVAAGLLERTREPLSLLIRARDEREAEVRLWRALQLHLDFPRFHHYLESRIAIYRGDIAEPRLGLEEEAYDHLTRRTESVIHCAASLNRRSERSCLNVNLRGTLEVIQLARRAHAHHGLRRFSHVSTVAVAGKRQDEVVREEEAIEWGRADYDPYARTKKFCEHMVQELLADVPRTIFRPSIVLGHSQHGETTQFDMARAFSFLAGLRVLPFRPADRLDIVPVDYVSEAIVMLHQKERPNHEIYHLSSGLGSETYRELTDFLARVQGKPRPVYVPRLQRPFAAVVGWLAGRGGAIGYGASLLKVFLPYLVWNTVFDNARVVGEMGRAPQPFSHYCYPLLKFSRDHHFTYPYRDWPGATASISAGTGP